MSRTLGAGGRLVLVLTGALALGLIQAAPASAHTISGPRPTNYRSRVLGVVPAVSGLSIRVVDLGNHLELVNHTSTDVVVLGYGGEPYLRVGPRGVFENLNSAATYLDRTRYGTTAVPAFATTENATAHPAWRKISGGDTVRWHDHRIHWMSPLPPPLVQLAPSEMHHLGPEWHVELAYGTQRVVVTGQLDWVPGPSGRPWVPVIVGCTLLGLAAAVRRRSPWLLGGALVVLVGIDAFHAVATELFRPGTSVAKTVQFFGDSFVSIIVWVVAVPTLLALRRRAPEARYGALFIATMIALVGGATDLSFLWKSQLPTAGPDTLQRAAVAVSLGLGGGLAIATLLLLIRAERRVPDNDHGRTTAWLPLLVGGLPDSELAAIAGQLDANEVIRDALRDVAERTPADSTHLFDGGLAFLVLTDDEAGSHRWIVEREAGTVREMPADEGSRAEIRTTFPTFLQLMMGTLRIRDAIASGRCTTVGDRDVVDEADHWLLAACASR